MSLIKVTAKNFEAEILTLSKHKPVLVDFSAPWCPPCRKMKPIIESISETEEVGFIDIEEDFNDEIADKYDVKSIPTFLVFKDGVEVGRIIGLATKETLLTLMAPRG